MGRPAFQKAIVRPPAPNFGDGHTTAHLGSPDHSLALLQHEAYCTALERCGLALTRLPADPRYPDSAFVEDTAIFAGGHALLTRPGVPSRQGEVAAIRDALATFYTDLKRIEDPGTLDGGDVCEAEEHVLIGISKRTNPEGARQLATFLASVGLASDTIDVRGIPGILHLKSGLAHVGHGRLVAIAALASHPALARYQVLTVDDAEAYAANCVLVNERILVPAEHPRTLAALEHLGTETIALAMSEFQKMDGGLSCLSLRF
ncbi:MAG TPA: arginine deiminase family protein [Candidatus Eisenbacteria bacterium]|nr:arginine deiminase family protein [Candidatus Eisenbacteria bacterium]